jgi:hypothetical protein
VGITTAAKSDAYSSVLGTTTMAICRAEQVLTFYWKDYPFPRWIRTASGFDLSNGL